MRTHHVKYLLVGGGVAASAAAQAIRELDKEGACLLVGQEVNRPYHRPPLSREFLLRQKNHDDLFTLSQEWFAENHVELRTGRRAARLDPSRRSVTLDDGAEVLFDKLLIATGGSPRHLSIPGADLPNVYYLRNFDDADRLHNAMEKALHEGRPHSAGRGRAAVIGGGLLGVELSATLTQAGLAVDLVTPASHLWRKFAGETAARTVQRYLEAKGVRVHTHAPASRLEGDGRVQRVVLPDQADSGNAPLPVDFVVAAIGLVPNKDLLRGTSLASERAILTDDHARTSHSDIYAAGDCAAIFDARYGKYRLLDHWQSAIDIGGLAGRNMAGADEKYDLVNTYASTIFDLSLRVWGESRHVSRHIVRSIPTGNDVPSLLEFGLTADGKISQVLALNYSSDHQTLIEFVRRRLAVDGNESALKDPAAPLASLI